MDLIIIRILGIIHIELENYIKKEGRKVNILVGFFFIVLISILNFPINFSINSNYYCSSYNNKGYITIKSVSKIINVKKTYIIDNIYNKNLISPGEFKGDMGQSLFRISKIINRYKNLLDYILSSVLIKKPSVMIKISLTDAHHLAAITGILWAIFGMLSTPITKLFNLDSRPALDIIPSFVNENKICVDFNCIITLKIAHIIVAALKYILTKLRSEFNVRASRPRFNENYNGKH